MRKQIPELVHPHDNFFKVMWGNPSEAEVFIEYYLPKTIVDKFILSSLKARKGTYVDKRLSQYHSDLLYEIKTKKGEDASIYILFEHKSYPDVLIQFQVLKYIVKIWEEEIKQGKKKLSVIIPVIVYHGAERWNVETNFHAIVNMIPGMESYVPQYQYELCDFSKYKDEEIKGTVTLRAAMLLMKYIFRPKLREKLPEIFRLIDTLNEKRTGLEFLETMLRYLSCATEEIGDNEIRKMLEENIQGGENIMATLAEKWFMQGREQGQEQGREQGQKQGLEKGLEQGLEEGRKQIILRLLERQIGTMDKKTRTQIEILSVSQVEKLTDRLLDFENIEELKSWLAKVS